jgi:DNA-binding MarR family transcriptional regulator
VSDDSYYHSVAGLYGGRVVVSDGLHPMSAGWARYHPETERVSVADAWGRPAWVTPTQHRVLVASRSLQDDHSERVSMAKIAASLGVAVSTVYRALIRLASLGLVSYDTKRGRSGGVAFVMLTGAALKARALAAWDRIKTERDKVAQRWNARLVRSGYDFDRLIIATISSRTQRLAYLSVGATAWTADDMAEVDTMQP